MHILPGSIDIKEPKNDNFFGYYRDFIKYKFPKSVNENNAGLFLDWIRENREMREIVKERYGEQFSEIAKNIFKQISEMLNFDLITKYISLQLTEKYAWNIVSNDIMKQILDNNEFRKFFINQLIKRSSSTQNFEMLIFHLPKNPITTYELPIYLKMYIDEKDEFRKTIIASLIKSAYREYICNGLTDDIDGIYELIHSNKELLDRFGDFINPVELNPSTVEPIDKSVIFGKEHYYSDLKNLLLSFGLEAKMTFKNEEFTKDGEIVAKLSISGKIVRLHLALDPNDPTLPFERYNQFSLAEKPSYKDVPFTVKIRSELLFRRCKELIRIVAEIKKLTKNESYQKQDFTSI